MFAKLILLKFEPLCCHTHGQHASVNVFQQIPSKQLFEKFRPTKYTRFTVIVNPRRACAARVYNTVPLLVLNWPTMCARVLCNKLSFLLRVCNGESTSLSTQVFRSIAVSDVTSMSIVKQCHFLDSILDTQFTKEVLNNPELSLRDLKKRILEADRLRIVEKSENHPSLSYILHIAKKNQWLKFWDVALEYGYDGSKSSMAILKSLCLTVFSDRRCPIHNCAHTVPPDTPLCQHFFECHTDFDSSITPEYITECILSSASISEHFMSLIPLGLSLLKALPF